MKTKLTKTVVEAINSGTRDTYMWDGEVRGFGCKVTPAGARVYILKYAFRGAQRWLTIVGTARSRPTKRATKRSNCGERSPAAKIPPPRDRRSADLTIDELGDRYLAEWAEPRKKPRSIEEDRRNLSLHIRPELGCTMVGDVSRQDVLRLHHKMRASPTAANRVQALLHKMFELSEDWGLQPQDSNPARRIQKYKESSRGRFLTAEEIARLGAAPSHAENGGEYPTAVAIIRLLLVAGCRLSEILSLQWSFVDFERGCLRLPDSKNGRKDRSRCSAGDGITRGSTAVFESVRLSSRSRRQHFARPYAPQRCRAFRRNRAHLVSHPRASRDCGRALT
jgi:integrase